MKKEKDELKSALEGSKAKLTTLRKELQEKKDCIAKFNVLEAEMKQVKNSIFSHQFFII